MIELFSIIIQIFVVIIFCYFPKKFYKLLSKNNNPNFLQSLEVGTILNIFILLFLSFTSKIIDRQLVKFFLIFYFVFNFSFLSFDIFKNYIQNKIKIDFLLLSFFFLVFVFSIDLSNNLKIGWDAQNIWLVKKEFFSNGGSLFELKNTPRDDYPFLGSYLWHIYSQTSFLNYEYFGRIFYIYLFVLSIFSISTIYNFREYEKIIMFFFIIFLIYKIDLFNGYQEILNFSLIVILIKIFYELFYIPNNKNYFLGLISLTLILNSILWIKNEGLVLVAIFLISIFLLKQIKLKIKFFLTFSFVLMYLFKFIMFDYIGLSNALQKDNYENFQLISFFEYVNLERILLVLKYFIFYSFEILTYPISLLIILIMMVFDKKNPFVNFIFRIYFINIGFFLLAFLLTSHPLEWHLKVALDRIMFQASGFLIILYPIFYNFLKLRNQN